MELIYIFPGKCVCSISLRNLAWRKPLGLGTWHFPRKLKKLGKSYITHSTRPKKNDIQGRAHYLCHHKFILPIGSEGSLPFISILYASRRALTSISLVSSRYRRDAFYKCRWSAVLSVGVKLRLTRNIFAEAPATLVLYWKV